MINRKRGALQDNEKGIIGGIKMEKQYQGQILDPRMPHQVMRMSLSFVRQNLEVIGPVSMVQFRRTEEGPKTLIYGRYGCLVTDGFEVGHIAERTRGLKIILREIGWNWNPALLGVKQGEFIEWTETGYRRDDLDGLSGLICKECGAEICFDYISKATINRMKKWRVCHRCEYWLEWVEKRRHPRVARINHTHYLVRDEFDTGKFRGFGGRKFVIEWDDGRRMSTTNLWHQGRIPEFFWDRLPDNAKFIK